MSEESGGHFPEPNEEEEEQENKEFERDFKEENEVDLNTDPADHTDEEEQS